MTQKDLREGILIRFARLLQKLPLKFFRFLEWPWIAGTEPASAKVVLLLALPRSGSTLTYQALIHRYGFQYLSNLGNLFYQIPLISGLISRIKCRGHYSNFRSQRGFIPGLCGPAEGLMFWKYWTGIGLKESEIRELTVQQSRRMRFIAKVYAKLTKNRQPIVTGYLGHVLGVDRVKEALPNAVLVRLVRNPIDNALSILNCMESDSNWFSVVPEECDVCKASNKIEKVANQVYWLNRKLDTSMDGSEVVIHYEELCKAPSYELEPVELECKKRGWDMNSGHYLPEAFKSHSKTEQSEYYKKLHSLLRKLEIEHGRLKYNSVLGK